MRNSGQQDRLCCIRPIAILDRITIIILNLIHVHYTVKPLIKDPPRKGQPLYNGHFQYPQECNTFQPPKRGQPPYKGQNGWSQSVPYSEVPLYISIPTNTVPYNIKLLFLLKFNICNSL